MHLDALVIGGDGLIGSALVRKLDDIGYNVVGTSRRTPPTRGALPFDLEHETWLPAATVTFLCTSFGNFNACAQLPDAAWLVNTTLVARLALRLKTTRMTKICLLSSSGVVSNPRHPYGASKAECECAILHLGGVVCRFGPLMTPGRSVYPDLDYQPVTLDKLTDQLSLAVQGNYAAGLFEFHNPNAMEVVHR